MQDPKKDWKAQLAELGLLLVETRQEQPQTRDKKHDENLFPSNNSETGSFNRTENTQTIMPTIKDTATSSSTAPQSDPLTEEVDTDDLMAQTLIVELRALRLALADRAAPAPRPVQPTVDANTAAIIQALNGVVARIGSASHHAPGSRVEAALADGVQSLNKAVTKAAEKEDKDNPANLQLALYREMRKGKKVKHKVVKAAVVVGSVAIGVAGGVMLANAMLPSPKVV